MKSSDVSPLVSLLFWRQKKTTNGFVSLYLASTTVLGTLFLVLFAHHLVNDLSRRFSQEVAARKETDEIIASTHPLLTREQIGEQARHLEDSLIRLGLSFAGNIPSGLSRYLSRQNILTSSGTGHTLLHFHLDCGCAFPGDKFRLLMLELLANGRSLVSRDTIMTWPDYLATLR